jgi:hypothetical protein
LSFHCLAIKGVVEVSDRNTWPIVIGGCFRSGTSLIRRVLNAHSRIHCGPEIKFFRDFYKDYFSDCLDHLRFISTARAILPEADLLHILGRAFVSIHERAAARCGKTRWADKAPENALYLEDWHRILGNSWVFIHVVRNPLDTLSSIVETSFPLSIPSSLTDRIALYRRYTLAGFGFGEVYPDRYYRLRYENFVRRPSHELKALMEWLSEVTEPQQLEFHTYEHQLGLEDPKILRTSGVHTNSVGRWVNTMTDDHAHMIWKGCGDLWKIVDPYSEYLPEVKY